MANVQALQRQGWYLTAEGIEECTENGKSSPDEIVKVALDLDLKQIGERHLPDPAQRCNKTDTVDGPFVLQIQKVRNITAPKDHEESQAAPQMLKLTLSDGHQSCVALELESIKNLGLNTPPGTKLKLQGKVPVNHGFLMLTNNNVHVLGGHVDKLVENWELKRTLAKHTRSAVGSEGGGPPPFIPFGQRRKQDDGNIGRKDDFKSLKDKDKKTPEDTEFEQQRQAIIDEALKSKEGASQKKFTGGVMSKQDRDIAKIVEMGFSADQANYALRQSNGNVEGAITYLLNQKGSDESSYNRDRGSGDRREGERGRGRGQGGPKGDHDPRQERGRGRRGKDDEEYEDAPSRPSAPATLFDFLNTKIIPKDEPDKDSNDKSGEPRESRSRKSSESEKRSLPNLPPRLIKQQQKREEEKQRQHYGRGGRNDYYEKPPQQNYRDNYRGGGNGGGYDNRPQYYGNPRSQAPPPQKNNYREYNDSRRNPDQGRPGHNDSNQKGNSGPPYGRQRQYDNYEGQYQEIPSSRYQQSTRRRDNQYDKRGDNIRDKDYRDYKDKGDRDGEKWNEYNNNGQYYGKDSNPQNNQSKQDARGQAYSNNRQSRPQRGQPPNSGNQRNQYRGRPGQQSGQGPSPQNTQSQPNVEQDPNQGGKPQHQRSYQQPVTAQSAPQTQSAPQQQQQPPPPPPPQQQQQQATQPIPPPQEVVQYQVIQAQPQQQNGETYMTQPVQVSQAYLTGPAPQLVQQMQEMQMSAVVVSSTSNLNPHSQSFQPENIIYTAPAQMQQVQLSTTGQQGYITIPQQHQLQGDVAGQLRQPRHWKPGDYCMAKYWEDKQYYRAYIHGVGPDGNSCYVTFPDYGNTENISMSDIHPVPKQAWETNNIQGPAVPVAVSSVAVQGSVASQLSQQVPGIIVQAHPTGIPMMTGFPTDQPYQGSIGNMEFAQGGGGVPYQAHIQNKQTRHSYGKPIPRSRPM